MKLPGQLTLIAIFKSKDFRNGETVHILTRSRQGEGEGLNIASRSLGWAVRRRTMPLRDLHDCQNNRGQGDTHSTRMLLQAFYICKISSAPSTLTLLISLNLSHNPEVLLALKSNSNFSFSLHSEPQYLSDWLHIHTNHLLFQDNIIINSNNNIIIIDLKVLNLLTLQVWRHRRVPA